MQKRTLIKKIQAIIKEFGAFTTADVQAVSSPIIASLGEVSQLAERFTHDKVVAITYDKRGDEIDEDNISYHDLTKDVLEDIYQLAENWEVECLQDEDRLGINQ